MKEQEFQQAIQFLSLQCPPYAELVKRLNQLLSDRNKAVEIIAHKMCHEQSIDGMNEHFQSIRSVNQQTLKYVLKLAGATHEEDVPKMRQAHDEGVSALHGQTA